MKLLVLLTAVGVSVGCAADTTTVIAHAGEARITAQEFLDRFTLVPWGGSRIPSNIESTKVEFARSLVAEKLLAQEAVRRGLDRDTLIVTMLEDIRNMMARDQLYLREVRERVSVTDDDIDAHLSEASFDRSVIFLIFARAGDAADVRSRIATTSDLEHMKIPRGARVERDSVRMEWGQAQPALQDAAWRLKPGELSPVVRTPLAFYILGLKSVKRNEAFLKKTFSSRRNFVAETLRRRREQETAARRATEMLSSRSGHSLPESFELLNDLLRRRMLADSSAAGLTLDPSTQAQLVASLGVHLGDTLTMAGRRTWTIGDALQYLVERRFTVSAEQLPLLPRMINMALREMVERELLSEEGLDRRLDTNAAVRYRLEMWRDAFLAARMRVELGRGVDVTTAELWQYARERDSITQVPEVRVREIRTRTRAEMQQALDALHDGMPFAEVVRRWSSDSLARGRDGVIDFFPATEREPVGPVAAEMRPGEQVGPLSSPDGFVTFELLEKREGKVAGDPRDTTLSGEIRREAVALKQRRIIDRELVRLRNQQGASVNDAAIHTLPTVPFPIVTYQMIGFGGRMLAAPPLPMEFQWWGNRASGEIMP